MTDKLRCCFCGAELEDYWYEYENGRGDTEYAKSGLLKCPDWDCRGYKLKLEPEIWQALIDGKKAQDALKGIEIRVAAIRSCVQDGYTQLGERNRNIFIALELFKDLTKEITSITKQEANNENS